MSSDIWKGEGAVLVRHGKKAMLVSYENEEAWVPYSQVHGDSELYDKTDPGESGVIAIPLWLAEKKRWA